MSSTVVSLALLKAMFDQNKSDLIDSFTPFASYVIEKENWEEFTSGQVKDKIDHYFSLIVPIHSIEMILIRIKKSGDIELISKKESRYKKKKFLSDTVAFEKFSDEIGRASCRERV